MGSLLISLWVLGYFVVNALRMLQAGSGMSTDDLPGVVLSVIVIVIVVEIIWHILITVLSGDEEVDERDRLIEAKASRVGYFVLTLGAIIAVGNAMFAMVFDYSRHPAWLDAPFATVSLLVVSIVFAEICKFTMQLYYYRRGV